MLPSTAMARLDFRLVPDLTPELVLKLLRDHLDVRGFKDIEIIELGNAPLAKSSASSSVARAVIGSAAEVYGVATAGLSDGSFERAGRRGLRSLFAAYARRIFRHQLRRIEPARTGRKYSR